MHRKLTLYLATLVATFLFFTHSLLAQNRVTGTVTDATGKAVAGATVILKGTNTATQTNESGEFTITAPAAGTLVISAVGFGTQEVAVQSRTTIPIQLTTQESNLNEVVVIGYGTARRKDITGAISSVQAKDFNRGVITTPDQLLQNKVPGLQVTTNSGQPGSATTVKIRGNNSIRAGSNALYVIDGVPLDGRSARPNFGNAFGSTPDANPLIFVNPNDIARIDVLKDASSAAIYGSRGANGVIAITTKTGTAGAPKLEFNTSVGVNAGLMKRFDVLTASEFKTALSKYNVANQDFGGNVDAMKELQNKKATQNYSLAFSGGSENGRFRASFLASEINGYLKNSTLDKYVGNFGGQYSFLDKRLTLGFNITAGHTTEDLVPVANTSGSTGNIISSILQWNPTASFRGTNGLFYYPTNGSGNPVALLSGFSDVAHVNSVLGNVSATVRIIQGLDYKFLYAVNNSVGDRYTNIYGFLQGYSGLSGSGQAAIGNARLTSQTFDHTLNYRTALTSQLNLEALVGYEYWTTRYQNSNVSAQGFNTNLSETTFTGIPYTSMLQNGNVQNPPGTFVDPKVELQSVFGRASLNYANKYFVTGTLRADGSSKFGSNNKYGYFPSVGVRWAVNNEDFMKGTSLFSNLALRASWGITGNQEFPAGASQEQFAFGSYNNASQINVANPNLKWEETKSYDIGLDLSTRGGKVNFNIDYYNKNTSNILFQSTAIQPAPASIYFINLPANLINKGVEIGLGVNVIDHKDLTWDIGGYYAHNDNKLTNFTQNGKDIQIITGQINGQGVSGTLAQVITNNYPVNEYFLKEFQGYDQNGNQTFGANPIYAGNPNPTNSFGVNTTLNYHKFGFVVNGGGESGYLIYNNTATSVTNIAGISNGRNIDKNSYSSVEKPTSPVAANTRFLESGNYFKLRNATLSYRVGDIGRYVRNMNVYVTGNNLFVITKFSGFDPEVNIDKSSNNYPSRSIEYIPFPTARTISVGVNLTLQ
ncbi:SusC/RagA family TonB-linked outer membrane protein [Flavisolibacter nicotianae]|uniref:SusC/RagA family TonB-linked outer membrane protein n=1 Tax=Flavisolibacter nicotianae TaxID=2364882 RepID=UPI000EB081C7|nr:SusC/RagA family TonB-linked outer membrane protein [Flavisolibacter nicotianae]